MFEKPVPPILIPPLAHAPDVEKKPESQDSVETYELPIDYDIRDTIEGYLS